MAQIAPESIIKTFVDAHIGAVRIVIGSKSSVVSTVDVHGMAAEVVMRTATLDVDASLHAVSIVDATPPARHTNILSVATSDAKQTMLRFKMTMFNRSMEEKARMAADDVDMAVNLRLSQMRFVFLNAWVNRMLVSDNSCL